MDGKWLLRCGSAIFVLVFVGFLLFVFLGNPQYNQQMRIVCCVGLLVGSGIFAAGWGKSNGVSTARTVVGGLLMWVLILYGLFRT